MTSKVNVMKTYTAIHQSKKAFNDHIKKIKAHGGVIINCSYAFKNGNIEYHYPKSFINKKYTHFAVFRSGRNLNPETIAQIHPELFGKIVNGWDYNGYDAEELRSERKHYFDIDLRDIDIDPKTVSILTKETLVRQGINPFDTINWMSR